MKKDDDQELSSSVFRINCGLFFLFSCYRASGIRYPRMFTTVLSSFRRARRTKKISKGKRKNPSSWLGEDQSRTGGGALTGLLTRPQKPEPSPAQVPVLIAYID